MRLRALRSWFWQLMGVGAVGVVSLVLDVAVLWVLDTQVGVPTALAAASGFTAGGVLNFALNRRVFRAADGHVGRQGARYLTLFVINLVITTVAVPVLALAVGRLVEDDGASLLVAKLATMAVLVVSNTVFYRHWVFATAPAQEPGPGREGDTPGGAEAGSGEPEPLLRHVELDVDRP